MSPLEIKALKGFSIRVATEGVDPDLKDYPVAIRKKSGEVVSGKPNVFLGVQMFTPVKAGEVIVISDVAGNITVTTRSGFAITKEATYSATPKNDQVTMTFRLEGTGFGEKPVTEIVNSRQAWGLKKPVPVKINRQKVAEVSWSEK